MQRRVLKTHTTKKLKFTNRRVLAIDEEGEASVAGPTQHLMTCRIIYLPTQIKIKYKYILAVYANVQCTWNVLIAFIASKNNL
jgi:hypothetical protein